MNKTDIISQYTGNTISFPEYKYLLSNFYIKRSYFRFFHSQHHAFIFQFNIVMNEIHALPSSHPIMIGTNLKANETKASIYLRGFPVRCYGALRLAIGMHMKDLTLSEMKQYAPTLLKSEYILFHNYVTKFIHKIRVCG